ncbi:glutaredoxin Grx1 [Saitoella complicata NRRL Y-17804]|uniref:glutaredoxin Grx1 n=1 Tax=Saitoella complicata (strain BCRC 22490 / CBS 7301 / JCM 7358 / NBRC 10748 / NRRL Y-17804) TaxID=698492 RepID=UPI000867F5A3|nr:glutaredoxin Grx1 [Saitoella complicata NRRL Y-17804]ODQ50854.1 glutaredoxin Grx1 [Saitoella complicata NRRL Y-17804]
MASAAKTLVEKLVKENAVVVFSKSYCPFCTKAKNLLVNKYAVFRAIELDLRDDGAAIQDYLKEKTNQSTVPNVFIGGKQVGGSSDLDKLEQSGSLSKLLRQAGSAFRPKL